MVRWLPPCWRVVLALAVVVAVVDSEVIADGVDGVVKESPHVPTWGKLASQSKAIITKIHRWAAGQMAPAAASPTPQIKRSSSKLRRELRTIHPATGSAARKLQKKLKGQIYREKRLLSKVRQEEDDSGISAAVKYAVAKDVDAALKANKAVAEARNTAKIAKAGTQRSAKKAAIKKMLVAAKLQSAAAVHKAVSAIKKAAESKATNAHKVAAVKAALKAIKAGAQKQAHIAEKADATKEKVDATKAAAKAKVQSTKAAAKAKVQATKAAAKAAVGKATAAVKAAVKSAKVAATKSKAQGDATKAAAKSKVQSTKAAAKAKVQTTKAAAKTAVGKATAAVRAAVKSAKVAATKSTAQGAEIKQLTGDLKDANHQIAHNAKDATKKASAAHAATAGALTKAVKSLQAGASKVASGSGVPSLTAK